jgi:hypothetical protein
VVRPEDVDVLADEPELGEVRARDAEHVAVRADEAEGDPLG